MEWNLQSKFMKLKFKTRNFQSNLMKDLKLDTLNLLSNLIGKSNNKTNFPHKLLLTHTQVPKICKAFANGS